jgi:Family of unknown function (DUF6343)
VVRRLLPRGREELAREDYHDPTAGFAGAPPARSALTLRLLLAGFGVITCGLGAAAFVLLAHQPVLAVAVALLGAIALVDLIVVARRKLRGEPG